MSAILAELQEMHLEKTTQTSAKDPSLPFEKAQLVALNCVEEFCREFKVLI